MACSQRNWINFTKLYSTNNNNNNNKIEFSTISIEVYSYHFYKCVLCSATSFFFLKKTGIEKTNKMMKKKTYLLTLISPWSLHGS